MLEGVQVSGTPVSLIPIFEHTCTQILQALDLHRRASKRFRILLQRIIHNTYTAYPPELP